LNKRLLVVAPNWIGDALLAQSLLALLRERHADATLDVIAPAWTAPVVERMPEVDAVIPTRFAHGELALASRWRLGRSLRGRYDAAWVLPNSLKSALVPWIAGIARRVGFLGEQRYGLLNVVHRLDEAALPMMAERYAQLAVAPGEPVPRPLPPTRLRVDEGARAAACARLRLDASRPVVAFCPGAEYGPAKRWPAERFATLARQLAAAGRDVWLFGSARDAAIGEAIVAAAPDARLTNLCGRTDLAAAIDLLSLAEGVVANDSGLMHVAAALGRPLVALYGSSSPAHTPPLDPRARLIWLGLECSPCYQRECPLGHFRCMREIGPEQVKTEVLALSGSTT
jgi:heptosyltransferase-2